MEYEKRPTNSEQLTRIANRIMRMTKDPLHDPEHIVRMRRDYRKFMLECPNIVHNKKIVDQAIDWHDTFKALTPPNKNWVVREAAEGLMSAAIFAHFAKKYPLDKDTTNGIIYAIRKHSILNIIPITKIEAKILHDLDELDLWDPVRLLNGISEFKIPPSIAIDSLLRHRQRHGFYFEWSRIQFDKQANIILKRLSSE